MSDECVDKQVLLDNIEYIKAMYQGREGEKTVKSAMDKLMYELGLVADTGGGSSES